jgi:hypothetical protein
MSYLVRKVHTETRHCERIEAICLITADCFIRFALSQ